MCVLNIKFVKGLKTVVLDQKTPFLLRTPKKSHEKVTVRSGDVVNRLRVICQEDIYHPQNSDIYHPQIWTFPTPKKKHLPGGQLPPPIFFFFFWRTFLGFFDLQLMEDIKDGKEEVLDEVVMEHIK